MKEIYSQICRLCLQITSDLLPIYGEASSDNISETIMACTVIKMAKNDGYPENICVSCIKRLNNAFEFKQLCENSDAFLRNYDVSKHDTDALRKGNTTLSLAIKTDQSNVTMSPMPTDVVESIICKEEENSLDENDVPNQFEVVFAYPEAKEEEMEEEYIDDPDPVVDLKNDATIEPKKRKPRKKSAPRGKIKAKTTSEAKNETGPHICKVCSKEFNTLTGLKNHERSHKLEKNTECNVCHKVFSHAGNMRRHALIHQGIKPHVCHLCGKKFSRSSTLRDHVDIHHAKNLKQYSCTVCDYTCFRRNALNAHMVIKHQSESHSKAKVGWPKPKPRVCDICNKTLSSTAALNMHMKIHNNVREHLCRHCGRAFHHKSGLLNHERIHTGEKPYVCPHCPKRFSQQIGLRIHVRTHTGERPYQCKLCLKTFSQQTHLRTHSFTHSGERRYACEVCNKRFALREGLRYHQMAHTGETPFKCVMCNRGFYIQYKLKVHMAKSHGIAMEIVKK